MNIIKTNAAPIVAGHIGSVVDVIAGKITSIQTTRKYNASDFKYGFELASPKNAESLGEALIVNGTCFTCSTDSNSRDFLKTISGDTFITSGAFLIPNEAKPTHIQNQQFTSPLSLNDYYDKLYSNIRLPLAFAGFFDFTQLHTIFIEKAPIQNVNIFDNQPIYYPSPSQIEYNVRAFLVGVIADYQEKSIANILTQLKVALYDNPLDKSHELSTHAHAITFNKPIDVAQDIIPEVVANTVHVLANESYLSSLNVEIFSLASLRDYGV